MMWELPDELWRRIIEKGVKSGNMRMRLSCKDVCCISITCKRLHRLSNEPSIWRSLLSSDFPSCATNGDPSKSLYHSWYQKDKAKRRAAHTRAVLRLESRVAEHSTRLDQLRMDRDQEIAKINAAAAELSSLRKVREASVALNVWQPEVIRGRHRLMVEQCAVPVDSRINALQMELKLCKHQLLVLQKTYKDENLRLDQAKQHLMSINYHPFQHFPVPDVTVDDSTIKSKRMKLHSTGSKHVG